MARKSKDINSGYGLALFGLPIATLGLVCLGILAWTLNSYYEVQDWIPVQERILKVNLETNNYGVSKGKWGRVGNAMYSHRLEARYEYKVDGVPYFSDQVALLSTSDIHSSWHKRRYKELRGYVGSFKTFPCYVNPKNPAEAILFRELRLRMVVTLLALACLFVAAGLAMTVTALFGKGGREKEAVAYDWRA